MAAGVPAMPQNTDEYDRWAHTALRRRMLDGTWQPDLEARVRKLMGAKRTDAIGHVDLSSNVLSQVATQLACLYNHAPTVHHESDVERSGEDVTASAVLTSALEKAGFTPTMQAVQRYTVGLREMFVRVHVDRLGRIILRPVFPDLVEAEASPDRPDVPALFVETRQVMLEGEKVWVRERFDIRDPSRPTYSATLASDDTDVTDVLHRGTKLGSGEYIYRYDDDTPYIPAPIYHAQKGARLFDAWAISELVEGSLTAAALWSFFGHCVRNASWPQRYILGAEPAGVGEVDKDGDGKVRNHVDADPAKVLALVRSPEFDGQPLIGQWAAGADPDVVLRAVGEYELRVAEFNGVGGANFKRMEGDARSGYSLLLDRENKREAARRLEPVFAEGDAQLFSVVAATLNRERDAGLPEHGWGVRYNALPPTPDELEAQRRAVLEELQAGLISKAEARAKLRGVSVDQAQRELDAMTDEGAPAPQD